MLPVDISAPAQQVWQALLERDFPAEVREILHRPQASSLHPVNDRKAKVNAALKIFVEQKLSRSEREKFKASGKYHSFEDVVTHLQESAEHWAKKGGPLVTARETLLKVLDRLGHFQTLFSIFPSQSAYMSPFCGALKVLLMVASNYESSVREIVDGLLEISDATREVAELSCLFHRDEIQKHVVLFYADILTFCWYALEWYNSKSWMKLAKNFRDCGFSKKMTETILEVRRDAKNIRRLSRNSSLAEIKLIGGQLSNLTRANCDVQTTLNEVNSELRQVSDNQQSIILGLAKGLEELKMQTWASHWRQSIEILRLRREERGRIEPVKEYKKKKPLLLKARDDDSTSKETSEEESSVRRYNLAEVIKQFRKSTGLTGYNVTKDLEAATRKQRTGGRCHPSDRLPSWISGRKSQLLWLQATRAPSQNTGSALAHYAADIVNSAAYADIPIIHYFCKRTLDSDDEDGDEDPVCALINSLSLQILLLFEKKILETDIALDRKRLARLSASHKEAWKFFGELVGLQPSLAVVIHCLEYYEDYPAAMDLMKRLNGLVEGRGKTVLKVLLTSKRRTTTLRRRIPEDAVVHFEIARHERGRKLKQRFRRRALGRTADAADRVWLSSGDERDTASSEDDQESGSEEEEDDSEDSEEEAEEAEETE